MQAFLKDNQARVRAVIKKMTGSYNEDIEQEVYLKSWENRDRYTEQGTFKAWITTLTVNLCRDYFRSNRYKAAVKEVADDAAGEIRDTAHTQEEIVDAKKRQKLILKAVDSLPSKLREVIVFYEFEEMSYEEIAKRLRISVGTVKSRLFTARNILSQKLAFLKGE